MRASKWCGLVVAALLAACGDAHNTVGPNAHAPTANLAFVLRSPGSNAIATITVEVTGPGIDSMLVFNFNVVSGAASGTAAVPAGSGRHIVALAYDAAGVNTHRGDTTVTVVAGPNPPISLVLLPLVGDQPLVLTFGTTLVTVSGHDTSLAVGDSVQLTASVLTGHGVTLPTDSVRWASTNPSIASVSATGLVKGLVYGRTSIVATYQGAAASRLVTVAIPFAPPTPPVTAGAVVSLLAGAYRNWYHSLGDVNPSAMVDVAADHFESAWGNWGMKLMGWEPRIYGMVNSRTDPVDDFRNDIEEPWDNNYAALMSANLVVMALSAPNYLKIPGPVDSSSNPMVLAAARFMQGAALSNIALDYDSGYVFDETDDPTRATLVGRDSVQRAALAKLDVAISLASSASPSWSIPESFLNQIGEAWTSTQLAQAANYWAARTIAYFPHNAVENAAADWARVASYASRGISVGTPFNLEIVGDGPGVPNQWWNDHMGISSAIMTWMRVNVRVTCLLDPGLECHRPNNNVNQPVPQSADYRFNGDDIVGDNCIPQFAYDAIQARDTSGSSYGAHCSQASKTGGADFVYLPVSGPTWTGFPAARGYYRFSNLAFIRYLQSGWDSPSYAVGRLPFVLAAENDLLRAEALVRLGGSYAAAAALINNTRLVRGHLPALTGAESPAQLLAAVMYERGIELFGAGPMLPWYDQRRSGPDLNPAYYAGANDSNQTGWTAYGTGLQPQTPRLLPVPDAALNLVGHPTYTYGGPTNPEPPAPPARGAPARPRGIVAPYGLVILGPGPYAARAEAHIAASARLRAILRRQ